MKKGKLFKLGASVALLVPVASLACQNEIKTAVKIGNDKLIEQIITKISDISKDDTVEIAHVDSTGGHRPKSISKAFIKLKLLKLTDKQLKHIINNYSTKLLTDLIKSWGIA